MVSETGQSLKAFCNKTWGRQKCSGDPRSFRLKIMSPEITTPLFVSPRNIPLTVRLAAKVLSGRKDLQKSPPAN